MSKPEVVFFGSGPVAAKSLELLLSSFEIIAVVTKPKPAHHRGTFPVIEVSKKNNLPLHTVSDKHELSELIKTELFQTDLAILIDFGIIVTKDVIDYFPNGIINSHFSLLPEWRGADPITFAILSGQPKTGVSLMVIDEGMDTGKILVQRSLKIDPDETTESLTDKLIELSDELLAEIAPEYLRDKLRPRSQPHPDRATYSRKITKDDGVLNFSKSAQQLEREIRAYKEWPKSHTKLADIDVVITSAHVADHSGRPGGFEIKDKQLIIFSSAGSLAIDTLKPVGKKEMSSEAFIAGYRSRLKI